MVTRVVNVASGMAIQAVTGRKCNRYVAGQEEVYVTTQVVATPPRSSCPVTTREPTFIRRSRILMNTPRLTSPVKKRALLAEGVTTGKVRRSSCWSS